MQELFNKLSMKSDKLIFFFIGATFLLLPVRTALPLISIGLACSLYFISGKIKDIKFLASERWLLPIVPFVLLPWVGLLYSKDTVLGLDYALKTKYWVAVFIVAGLVWNENRTRILIKIFWSSLVAGSILGFFQYFGVLKMPSSGYSGFGIVYTVLSMYLIVGLITATFAFRTAKNSKEKLILIFLVCLFLFHLLTLKGRNGYFVLILLSPWLANNLMPSFRKSYKALIIALLILAISVSPVVQNRIQRTIEHLQQTTTIIKGEWDVQFPRPYMVHQAVKLFLSYPLIGAGTGSLHYYTAQEGHPVSHPHNSILYMAASFGSIGVAVYFWIFGQMFIMAWKRRTTMLGNFILAICTVIFLGGIFETPILNSGTSLLLPLGYGLLKHLDASR